MNELKGDLFSSKDNLAHCVSLDFKMGAGIAVKFKSLFGRVDELKKQCKYFPSIAILKNENKDEENNKYIYYLVTKKYYYNKPTYESLNKTLILMNKHMTENNIKSLSIPRLGCGLDKLDWNKVKVMISEIFKDKEITVYYL